MQRFASGLSRVTYVRVVDEGAGNFADFVLHGFKDVVRNFLIAEGYIETKVQPQRVTDLLL